MDNDTIMGQKMHDAAIKIVNMMRHQEFSNDEVLKIYCILIATRIRSIKAISPETDNAYLIAEILSLIMEIVNGEYDIKTE